MALTKHPEGSLKELWSIAFPLMISSLSVMSMLFIDRLMLAHYSTSALNAAVNAATLGWAFAYGSMVLTSIAEVFVAQHNGAQQKEKIGEPVWQMIWLSIATSFFFIYLAYWGNAWFFGSNDEHELERGYFKWMMLFAPSFPIYGALCGFFVGRGKTQLITWLAIAANLFNAIMDYLLIFGVEGWIPSFGIEGAAIATSASGIFQVLILAVIFLSPRNQMEFHTKDWRFKPKVFKQCLRFGIPGAVFVVLELLGWAAFYGMMSTVGEKHITLAGICQSIALLFYFFADGISKAATTIAGNFIGAKREHLVNKMLKAGMNLHILIFTGLLTAYFLFSDFMMRQFLNAQQDLMEVYYPTLKTCLLLILCYLLFEGYRLLFAGVLIAAGDTFFLLIAGSLSVWLFLVAPVYYFVVIHQAEVEVATFICVIYSILACIIYYWRFYQGKWKSISLIAAEAE